MMEILAIFTIVGIAVTLRWIAKNLKSVSKWFAAQEIANRQGLQNTQAQNIEAVRRQIKIADRNKNTKEGVLHVSGKDYSSVSYQERVREEIDRLIRSLGS